MFVEVFDEVLQTIVSVSKHFSTHHEWSLIMRNKTTALNFSSLILIHIGPLKSI